MVQKKTYIGNVFRLRADEEIASKAARGLLKGGHLDSRQLRNLAKDALLLRQAVEEVKRLRIALAWHQSELERMDPHLLDGPDGRICFQVKEHYDHCPTYYDGCNCTVSALEHNIRRAEAAELRVKELEHRVKDLEASAEGETQGTEGKGCWDV